MADGGDVERHRVGIERVGGQDGHQQRQDHERGPAAQLARQRRAPRVPGAGPQCPGDQEAGRAPEDLGHDVRGRAEPARHVQLARLHRRGEHGIQQDHAQESAGQRAAGPSPPHHQHAARHPQQGVRGHVGHREPPRNGMRQEAREGIGVVTEVEREERSVRQEEQVQQHQDGRQAARVHRSRA